MNHQELLDVLDEIDKWVDRFKIDISISCSDIAPLSVISSYNGGVLIGICPHQSITLGQLIFHLNDDHHFSFTKIADILEEFNLNMVIK